MKKKIFLLPLFLFLLILLTFSYLLIIDRYPQEIPSNLINKKIPNYEANSLFIDKIIAPVFIFPLLKSGP